MMRTIGLLVGAAFLAAGVLAGGATAAEVKVLSTKEMQAALQELAPAFEKSTGNKLKIEYAAGDVVEKRVASDEEIDVAILTKPGMDKLQKGPKIVGNTRKVLVPSKEKPEMEYVAASSFWAEQPIAAKALIDFLAGPKAADVYKAKGPKPAG